MVQFSAKYDEDVDIIDIRSNDNYIIDQTLDLGKIIMDLDGNKPVNFEILWPSTIMDISPKIINKGFDFEIQLKNEDGTLKVVVTLKFIVNDVEIIKTAEGISPVPSSDFILSGTNLTISSSA